METVQNRNEKLTTNKNSMKQRKTNEISSQRISGDENMKQKDRRKHRSETRCRDERDKKLNKRTDRAGKQRFRKKATRMKTETNAHQRCEQKLADLRAASMTDRSLRILSFAFSCFLLPVCCFLLFFLRFRLLPKFASSCHGSLFASIRQFSRLFICSASCPSHYFISVYSSSSEFSTTFLLILGALFSIAL